MSTQKATSYEEPVIDLSKLWYITNPKFRILYELTERIVVCMGGAGSGKSVAVAQFLAVTAMLEPGHHIIAFRKVAATMRTSVFAEFKQALVRLGVLDLWRSNLTELTWTFSPNGSVFRCHGLDDVEKLKSIYGMTRAWIEEATEASPKDLKQINLRLRPSNRYVKQIILTFNPINAGHWLNRRFFHAESKGRWATLISTFKDNTFLDKEYVAEILAYNDSESPDFDPYMWDVYGLAKWGIVGNLVYMPFIETPWPSNVIKMRDDYGLVKQYRNLNLGSEYAPTEELYGIDFGFNAPTALVHLCVEARDIYVTELLYEKELTTSGLISRMKKLGIPYTKTPKKIVTYLGLPPIYADSAAPGEIEEIHTAGFNVVPADKHPGSINAGIKIVKSYRIHTKDDNVNINTEQASYHWQEDREGNKLDIAADEHNHAMDAMRYPIYTHLRGRIEDEVGVEVEDFLHEDFFPDDDLDGFFDRGVVDELIQY